MPAGLRGMHQMTWQGSKLHRSTCKNHAENKGAALPHLCIEDHVTREYQKAAVQFRLHPQKHPQLADGNSTPEVPPVASQNHGR